MNCKVT